MMVMMVIFIRYLFKRVTTVSCTPLYLRKPLFFLLLSSICATLDVLFLLRWGGLTSLMKIFSKTQIKTPFRCSLKHVMCHKTNNNMGHNTLRQINMETSKAMLRAKVTPLPFPGKLSTT